MAPTSMGNRIYEEKNKEKLPEEAFKRMCWFLEDVKEHILGPCADFGAGSGELATLYFADMYDFYPANEDVHFIDLMNRDFYPFKSYQTIFLNHVLEHVRRPEYAVKATVTDCMRSGSKLIVNVPLDHPDNKHRPRDASIGHVSYFTVFSLFTLLSTYLDVIMIKRVNYDGYMEIYAVGERT